jgi:hypothetical protein
MRVTNINEIAKEIAKQVELYTEEVKEKVEDIKKTIAKELVSDIKHGSPEKTGSYVKGWGIKSTPKKLIVHNKTDYQLTHLLEYGHVKKNGGRTEGKPHIRTAEEAAIREYLKQIERAIKT